MPLKQGKKTVGATVTDEVYDRIKRVAMLKHWSVAQTLALFIDSYWENWEKDLGIEEEEPKPTPKKGRKPKSIA
jgi:hypothetical protein